MAERTEVIEGVAPVVGATDAADEKYFHAAPDLTQETAISSALPPAELRPPVELVNDHTRAVALAVGAGMLLLFGLVSVEPGWVKEVALVSGATSFGLLWAWALETHRKLTR